ncbi:MAG TPA: P-loop NTPase fold protein [Vicinamibacterales bacterium]
MADIQTADVSPERIQALPDRAKLAFAARYTLRVLPAFLPPLEGSRLDAGGDVSAAIACCFVVLRAAIDPVRRYQSATQHALAALTGRYTGTVAAAKDCLSLAARATLVSDSEELSRLVISGFNSSQAAAEAFGDPTLFAVFAGDDISELESLGSSTAEEEGPTSVPLAFFRRPLYRTNMTPGKWPALLAQWRDALGVLQSLRDVDDLYARLHEGSVTGTDDLAAIDRWIQRYENQFASVDTEHRQNVEDSAAATPEPSPKAARPPDVWMLSDRPLEGRFAEQDRFQFTDYADALATILDHPRTETPFTMAINAPWGAGKTSLAKMIAAQLEQRPKDRGAAPHIICWFNAWMHDDAPDLATAFVSQVSRTADQYREPLTRVLHPLPAAILTPRDRKWRRMRNATLAIVTTFVALYWVGDHLQHLEARRRAAAERLARATYQFTDTVIIAGGTETGRTQSRTRSQMDQDVASQAQPPDEVDFADRMFDWLQTNVLVLGAFFTALAGLVGFVAKVMPATSLGGFVQAPKEAAATGTIPGAQAHLGRLIEQATWRGNRFVVFIDDIERCKPPRSIDVLDAANQLLDHPQVIVVLLGDMSAVAAAAQLKYTDLAETLVPSAGVATMGPERAKEAFGRLYLQKIVQFQFDLPIPPPAKIQAYMSDLAAGGMTQGDVNAGTGGV